MTVRLKIIFTLLLGGISLFCFPAYAAEDKTPISVKAEIDRAFLTIGDPVEYTVTIRHSPSVQILSQIPPPAGDILEIKKIREFKREEKGSIVEGRTMTLTAFRLGEFILDPVKIEYLLKEGEVQSIQTDRLYLTVKSVAGGEIKTDIRGVKTVETIKNQFLKFVLALTLLLVFSLIGYFIYRRFQKAAISANGPEDLLSPEEEALLHLNQLFDSDLLKKGRVKEYFLRFSEILRVYFEKRFEVLAVESTTYELLRLLRKKDISRDLLDKIEETLESSDLAKFAKWKPEPREVLTLNEKAKEIIEAAKPKEVESGL